MVQSWALLVQQVWGGSGGDTPTVATSIPLLAVRPLVVRASTLPVVVTDIEQRDTSIPETSSPIIIRLSVPIEMQSVPF